MLTIRDRSEGRQNNFDFLRFVAASLVVYSHAYAIAGMGGDEPLVVLSHAKLDFGKLALYIFFAISGFLISQSFDRSRNLATFIAARALRIYPALITSILISAMVIGPYFTTFSLKDYFHDPLFTGYLKSISLYPIRFYLPGVFESNAYQGVVNGPIWTIPLEVGCYGALTLLGILGLLQKRLFILMSFVLLVYLSIYGAEMPFIMGGHVLHNDILIFITLAMFFFSGMVVYAFRDMIVLSHTAAMFSVFILAISLKYGGVIPCLAIFGTYVLFYFCFNPNIKLWSFAKYGDFSYGIYVYAFPLQQAIAALHGGKIFPYLNFVLAYPIILSLSCLSWHLIEHPALKLKASLPYIGRFHFKQLITEYHMILGPSWLKFFIIFPCFAFYFFSEAEIPSAISFPDHKNQALLKGGWQHQQEDEGHRWLTGSGNLTLSVPKEAKAVHVEGYLPKDFVEVTEALVSISGELRSKFSLELGKLFHFTVDLKEKDRINPVINVELSFNGRHKPPKESGDKRELSALIKTIYLR